MKSILVTGASGDIGKGICSQFYKKNWQVYGTSTSDSKIKELKKEFPRATFYNCDMNNVEDIIKVYQKISKIDLLVNNAGTNARGKVDEVSLEDYENIMNVNVRGPFLMMKYAIPIMRENGGGKIINIASTVGTRECPYVSLYAASKHALVGLSHSVREEVLADKIYVSTIYPGATDTAFQLPGKTGLMNLKEVIDAVYFTATRKKDTMVDLFIYPAIEKRKP